MRVERANAGVRMLLGKFFGSCVASQLEGRAHADQVIAARYEGCLYYCLFTKFYIA